MLFDITKGKFYGYGLKLLLMFLYVGNHDYAYQVWGITYWL